MEGGDIGLEGAVGLHGDKAPLCAQTDALGVDEPDVAGVDLGHHHGHVLRPAVGAVVGHHRALQAGVPLLQGLDLLLVHVHGAEDEVHHAGNLLRVGLGVQNHQSLGLLGDGGGHGPAVPDRLLVALAGAAAAGGDGGETEPGVSLHQCDKTLAHHSGAADDSNAVFLPHIGTSCKNCLAWDGEFCRILA